MPSGTWNVDANGNWSTTTNWVSNQVASGAGFAANFTNNITAARTVTVDATRTIGSMVFADSTSTFFGWTLAGTSTLTLNNSASTPTIAVNNAATTISAPLLGTAGFTKSGNNLLQITNAASTNTITGTITVSGAGGAAAALTWGTSAVPVIPTAVFPGTGVTRPSFSVAAANDWVRLYTTGTNVEVANVFSGLGVVAARTNSATPLGPNFAAGSLAGLTGTPAATGTGATIAPTSGFTLDASGSSGRVIVTAKDVPATLNYWVNTATATTATFKYAGTLPAPAITGIWLGVTDATAIATSTLSIEANQTSGGPLTIDTIYKDNDIGGIATFTLGGTNTGDNTVSGVISSLTAANLALRKEGAGRWVLSAANTYNGGTTVAVGTLAARNNTALGGSVTVSSGATLDIAGGLTIARVLEISGTGVGGTAGAINNTADNNTMSGSITLGANTTINVAAGSQLTQSGVLTYGANTLTKAGAGRLVLSGSTATGTGGININEGTVYITVSNVNKIVGPATVASGATLAAFTLNQPMRAILNSSLTLAANSTVLFGAPA